MCYSLHIATRNRSSNMDTAEDTISDAFIASQEELYDNGFLVVS